MYTILHLFSHIFLQVFLQHLDSNDSFLYLHNRLVGFLAPHGFLNSEFKSGKFCVDQEWFESYLSNEKNPGCLGYIGDYTTQLYGDYNKPF